MRLPPWFGPIAEGATAPDPIIYWFAVPVIGYLGALIAAIMIAYHIDTRPKR
jgi:hypothetical protein